MVQDVDDILFNKYLLSSPLPIVVDFWAPWCGPCLKIAPLLEEFSQKYEQQITFLKINVDLYPKLSAQYNISSIPNIKIFLKGIEIKNIIGAHPRAKYEAIFNEIINQK